MFGFYVCRKFAHGELINSVGQSTDDENEEKQNETNRTSSFFSLPSFQMHLHLYHHSLCVCVCVKKNCNIIGVNESRSKFKCNRKVFSAAESCQCFFEFHTFSVALCVHFHIIKFNQLEAYSIM